MIPIKSKAENQAKVVKVYPYQFKKTEGDIINFAKNVFKQYETNVNSEVTVNYSPKKWEVAEYPIKEAKKASLKTERLKFKRIYEKPVKKEHIYNIAEPGTMLTARDMQSTVNLKHYDTGGFDSSSNTFKWTMKSRGDDRAASKTKHIDDFERLFYQSMSNEKGIIVSQKGIDWSQIKNTKANTSHYKALSKSKSTKHIKNKKSVREYEIKQFDKAKPLSPTEVSYKGRCASRMNKWKPPVEDTSKCSGYVKTLGAK